MKLSKKLAAAAATSAMLMNAMAPLALATDLIITGNGSEANSAIEVTDVTNNQVVQDNDTNIVNTINLTGNTGENSSNKNVGGDIHTETGDADASIHVSNMGNTNSAVVDNCDCDDDLSVDIDGNGENSENWVGVNRVDAVDVFQTNSLDLENNFDVDLNTGRNESDKNTGADVLTVTGDADATIEVMNTGNANSAVIAGSGVGSAWVGIVGNGSDSLNGVELGLVSTALLTQANDTNIKNNIGAWLNTGENTSKKNTGGDVATGTGDADLSVVIDNAAGFNDAYFGHCDCDEGIMAKIGENGEGTENWIGAVMADTEDVFQNNACEGACFDNHIEADANTGRNDSDKNTGDSDSDPLTLTGDTDLSAVVDNLAGANTYGSGMSDYGSGLSGFMNGGLSVDVDIDFSLGDLLSALGY